MTREDRFCPSCGAPAPVEGGAGAAPPPRTRYMRPVVGKKIAGVCAGIARQNGWDVTLVRVVFLAAILLDGLGLLAYLIAWIAMPREEYFPYPAR
jgi:phage shock protein PspC (stress-responsive transcriptional regulator)